MTSFKKPLFLLSQPLIADIPQHLSLPRQDLKALGCATDARRKGVVIKRNLGLFLIGFLSSVVLGSIGMGLAHFQSTDRSPTPVLVPDLSHVKGSATTVPLSHRNAVWGAKPNLTVAAQRILNKRQLLSDILPEDPAVANLPMTEAQKVALEARKETLAARISENYSTSTDSARQIVDKAYTVSEKHQINPLMLLAIVAVESSFNPRATSSAGALGLTQTMPRAHPEKLARVKASGKTPYDMEANLGLGAEIFAEYRQRFKGNQVLALQQYNGALSDKRMAYAGKVLAALRFLSKDLPPLPRNTRSLSSNSPAENPEALLLLKSST